jgi:hypothetical protein
VVPHGGNRAGENCISDGTAERMKGELDTARSFMARMLPETATHLLHSLEGELSHCSVRFRQQY